VIHPKEDLAKFGYRPCLKVKTSKNHFMFWLPAGTYCRNMAILIIKKIYLGPFFTQIFVYVEIIFFRFKKRWKIQSSFYYCGRVKNLEMLLTKGFINKIKNNENNENYYYYYLISRIW
jgi:hypothetical protein